MFMSMAMRSNSFGPCEMVFVPGVEGLTGAGTTWVVAGFGTASIVAASREMSIFRCLRSAPAGAGSKFR